MLSEMLLKTEPSFTMLLIEFTLSSLLVVLFALKLTKFADALERKSDISALFIGGLMLAVITSLPELAVTIGAGLLEGALDLGVGNLFGSNIFNLVIVVLLDLLNGRTALVYELHDHLRVDAVGSIALMLMVVVPIALQQRTGWGQEAAWLGPAVSVAIVLAYIFLKRFSTSTEGQKPEGDRKNGVPYSLRCIVTRISMYALLLVLISVWLLLVCNKMAVTPFTLMGADVVLGRTVTGSFLLSAATSCPELFVCLAAFRLGQKDMAVANVLGSNMVNMAFVPVMHLIVMKPFFYTGLDGSSVGVLLAVAIVMTLLLVRGLLAHHRKRCLVLSWETAGMLAVYVAGALVVLRMGLRF